MKVVMEHITANTHLMPFPITRPYFHVLICWKLLMLFGMFIMDLVVGFDYCVIRYAPYTDQKIALLDKLLVGKPADPSGGHLW